MASFKGPFSAVQYVILDVKDPIVTHVYAWARRLSDWNTGEMLVSVEDLAERSGVAANTVRRAMKALSAMGVAELRGSSGSQRWWMVPPSVAVFGPPAANVTTPPSRNEGVARVMDDRVKDVGDQRSPVHRSDPIQMEASLREAGSADAPPADEKLAKKERQKAKARANSESVERVLKVWGEVSGNRDFVVDLAMRTTVLQAINLAGVDKCVLAVQGIWQDEWWSARKPTISQALRNAESIERFASMAPKPKHVTWNEFLGEWEEHYVAGIRRVSSAPKVPPSDRWNHWPIRPVAESTVDGIHAPVYEDPMLTIAAQNAAGAMLAYRSLVAKYAGDPNVLTWARDTAAGRMAELVRQVEELHRRAA